MGPAQMRVALCYSSNFFHATVYHVEFSVCPWVKKHIRTFFWVVKAIRASSKGQLQGVLTKFILAKFINFELGFW